MKAILVVDMPTVCGNCVLEQYCVINHKGYSYCGACGISTKNSEILKDCPLKPMPSKKETARNEPYSIEDYRIGWNACLEETTK